MMKAGFKATMAVSLTLFASSSQAQEAAGKWLVASKTSALTGLETLTASLTSEEPLINHRGKPELATLVIRCQEGVEAAYVAWPEKIQPSAFDKNRAIVFWKLDDGPIQQAVWDIGQGYSRNEEPVGAFETRDASSLVRQVQTGKRLVVRMTGVSTQDAVFDLTGVGPLAERIETACGVPPPGGGPGPVTAARIDRPKAALFDQVRHELESEGFQITAADPDAGKLATAPLPMHLSMRQADCGSRWGIPYLIDGRTKTRVALVIAVQDGEVDIRSTVAGVMEVNNPGPDFIHWHIDRIPLTCTSRGAVEAALAKKLRR